MNDKYWKVILDKKIKLDLLSSQFKNMNETYTKKRQDWLKYAKETTIKINKLNNDINNLKDEIIKSLK